MTSTRPRRGTIRPTNYKDMLNSESENEEAGFVENVSSFEDLLLEDGAVEKEVRITSLL